MFSLGPVPEDVRVVPGIMEGCALAAEAQRRKHLPALLAPADFQEARSGEGKRSLLSAFTHASVCHL